MSFAYHGNFCGPGWSAGEWQNSVVSDVEPIDEFDASCKVHDELYATRGDLGAADSEFAYQNLTSLSPKRMFAGAIVGAQGFARAVLNRSQLAMSTMLPFDDPYQGFDLFTEELEGRETGEDKLTTIKQPLNTLFKRQEMKNKTNNKKSKTSQPRSLPPAAPRRPVGQANGRTGGRGNTRNITAAPVSLGVGITTRKPRYSVSRTGGTVITHREYIGQVTGAATFTATAYECNPGSALTTPWLSRIASNYDAYVWKQLKYVYVPAVSSATAGRFIMAFNYNAADPPPQTKQEIVSINPCTEVSVWTPAELSVPITGAELYTRQWVPIGVDIKTYDMGNLTVGVDLGGATTIGELYVEYVIELMRPHPSIRQVTEIAATGIANTSVWPSTSATTVGSTMVGTSLTANSITFYGAGRYLVLVRLVGSVISAITPVATTGGFNTVAGYATSIDINTATTSVLWTATYDVTLPSANVPALLTINNSSTTVTSAYFIATRLDAGQAFTMA